MPSQNTRFPETQNEYGSFCLHVSQNRPRYAGTVKNAILAHVEGKAPAARVKATGTAPESVFKKSTEVARDRIYGRWHCDDRISSNCVSRGFLKAEGIDFERRETRDHPYLVATGEPYQAIGEIMLQVTFPGVQGVWELQTMIMDYKKLCHYDEPRQNSLISTGDLVVQNDRPLMFDLLLGQEFMDDYQRKLDAGGTQKVEIRGRVVQ